MRANEAHLPLVAMVGCVRVSSIVANTFQVFQVVQMVLFANWALEGIEFLFFCLQIAK